MPSTPSVRHTRWFFSLLVAALTFVSSGCLAAAVTVGVVGAGAAGYVYYQGAVPRNYPVGMDSAWTATQQALTDLGMPILSAVRDSDSATIETRTEDGDKVKITLEPRASRVPADGEWTHVSVRVALLGDDPVTERILNQIDTHLPAHAQPAVQQAPVAQTAAPPLAK
jgi:hypothetical protein